MPSRDYIRKLAEQRYDGEIENAILDLIDRVSGEITYKELEALIRSGDPDAVARRVADMLPDNSEAILSAMGAAAAASGKQTVDALRSGSRVKVQFDRGADRLDERVRALHAEQIREVTDETREAVRQQVRLGLERGENPRDTARRIKGRWDKQAGKYRGGTIGLTAHQEGWVRHAEDDLRKGQFAKYLGRKLRDKRHDATILKARREGKELTEAQIQKMLTSYRRKAVQYRAETIARDQSLAALDVGQDEAADQVVEQGGARPDEVIKMWVTASDARVRDGHEAIPATNRGGVPKDQPFETPYGPMMKPRDRSADVPAEAVIQCRCVRTMRIKRNA